MLKRLNFFSWVLRILRNAWLNFLLIFQNCGLLEAVCNESHHTCSSTNHRKSDLTIDAQQRQIPQPKGWPLVGTLFDLIAAGAAPKLHKYIDRRHQELGPIFRERLGGTQDAVFVASASLMSKVFLYEGQYPRHPLPDAWTLYNKTHKCERGLFFMEGAEWSHNRRLLNRLMLLGNLDWMQTHIEACTERLVYAWRLKAVAQRPGDYVEIIDLEQQLYRWAIDVICAIMFGGTTATCPQIELALTDFARNVHKIFEHSALLMNFPPKLAKVLNMKMWSQFEHSVTEVLHKGFEIIDMFVALRANDSANAAVEHTESLFCKLQAAGMPLELIKRIFVDLVIAAGDTTAYSSEWALYLLSQDAELQQRLSAEVAAKREWALYLLSQDAELQQRLSAEVAAKRGEDMPLVHGLIRETLRLYPVAPFIGRYLATDAVIDGYHIEKDTLVLLSLYTAGREADHFPDPLAVKPERWQRNAETNARLEVLKAQGSLPFASGIRSCIGKRIATNQMHSLITAIASNFSLKCTNIQPIDCVLRLVTVPSEPLQLAIRIRDGGENA